MSPRRRPPVDEPERDNWHRPTPFELRLVEERVAALEASPPELPPREPVPLATIEHAWSLEASWIEPYLARSIAVSGGFRPILERAFRMR